MDDTRAIIARTIRDAAEADIYLSPRDFTVVGGDVYLDGMDPSEWLHAMTMD